MGYRDVSFTVSLCVSLVVHALLVGVAAEMFTRQFARSIRQPGIVHDTVVYQEDQTDPRQRLGDPGGTGQAIASAPGDLPMLAPQGMQDQPLLSLDPAGPGLVSDEPVDSVLAMAQPPMPAPRSFAHADQPVVPFGLDGGAAADLPGAVLLSGTGSWRPAPDPAPQGSTESDPISTVGSVEFRGGSTEVRLGRKYRLTRPRLSLAAQVDLITLPSPVVVLKLKIDPTGKVTSAEIYRSSGSNEIDQPCKLAAYDWWFEPARDRDGKAVEDVILFAIRFIRY